MRSSADRPSEVQIRLLYETQERLYRAVSTKIGDCDARLIGGTVLSRCFLNHRVSFDLDFSLNPAKRNDIGLFDRVLDIPGVHLLSSSVGHQNSYAFCFYVFEAEGVRVEFSIGEDRMFRYYEPEVRMMGQTEVNTVSLETLYLNKLRAIAGDMPGCERQKLRDVFDVLVLSRKCRPLGEFVDLIGQKILFFDQDRFFENLAIMPWHHLASDNIFAFGQWREFEAIDKLSDALYVEAGMEAIDDDG